MNDQQLDRLIGRLEVTATPNPDWVTSSVANLLPAVREARRYDASWLGQAACVLASLRRFITAGGSRKTYLSVAIALLLTGTVVAFLVGGATRPPPGGPEGLLILSSDSGLQTIDIRDGTTKTLLPPDVHATAISRSPDGRLLAYRVPRGDGTFGYEEMEIDGTNRRPVATDMAIEGQSCNDVWSPNSRSFVTGVDIAGGPQGRIVVIDAGTGRPTFVSAEGEQAGCPIFAPDGEWVAYTARGFLEKVRPDGTGNTIIRTGVGGATSWSSDGKVYWDDGGGVIWWTDIDSGKSGPVSTVAIGSQAFAPALSPDGRSLAALYFREAKQSFDLYLSNSDGTKAHPLLQDVLTFGGWSTDGKYLLAVHKSDLGSRAPAGFIAITPAGVASLIAPFSQACPPTMDSPCFKDLGWGTSRP